MESEDSAMARTPKQRRIGEAVASYTTRPLSEVFWMAFKSLPEEDRDAFLAKLLGDPEMYDDIADAVTAIERRGEPTRPYREFREELRREGLL